mmetsp:Transcript_29483/g.63682  ORF Transcript_29483/g.63682 Transcript_29483/m.63682 type:complete len:94 (-) Transcript_29483:1162-1443(-)
MFYDFKRGECPKCRLEKLHGGKRQLESGGDDTDEMFGGGAALQVQPLVVIFSVPLSFSSPSSRPLVSRDFNHLVSLSLSRVSSPSIHMGCRLR